MPTTTTNYDLLKPLVNDPTDEDLWGGYLNDNADSLDALLLAGITNATQSSQTSGFTATGSISVRYLYPCDASGGAFAATLPSAATAGNGATIIFKKTDSSSNAITITRAGSDTIDGATTQALTEQYSIFALVSDGVSAWNSITKPTVISDATTSVKGIIEIATNSEFQAGSATDKAIVPSNFVKSLSSNGYMRIGALILQWGQTSSFSSSTTVTFPLAFPTSCLQAFCGTATAPTGVLPNFSASSLTSTTFLVTSGTSTSVAVRWFAIGY